MLETYRQDWADFLQVQTLCRRAGCRPNELALVAAKELIDNAFDASPRGVEVIFLERLLTVEDKGPGMSEEQALAIFNVKRPSLSSKRWRLARRGALGNGVRVIMGVVHVSAVIEDALRDALPRAYVPPAGKIERQASSLRIGVKEAVYMLIEETYATVAAAGIGAPPRMLMYRCRPEILRLTGRNELNYPTFKKALYDFMDDFPAITADWSILQDDRGHFIAPLRDEFRDRCEALAEELRGSAELDIIVPPLEALVRQHLVGSPDDTWREAVATIAQKMEEGRAA